MRGPYTYLLHFRLEYSGPSASCAVLIPFQPSATPFAISILSDLAPLARSLYISSSFQCAQLRSLLGASPPLVCPSYYLQLWCSRSPKPICAEGGCVANITATALSTPNTHTRIPRPPGADFQHSDVKWERIVGVDGQVMRACVSLSLIHI